MQAPNHDEALGHRRGLHRRSFRLREVASSLGRVACAASHCNYLSCINCAGVGDECGVHVFIEVSPPARLLSGRPFGSTSRQ
jgi:hypothetical protein